MNQRQTLYDTLRSQREVDSKSYQRVMLAGYFNEEEVKRDSISVEQYIRESLAPFRQLKTYTYVKGVFYVQLLESPNIAHINAYLTHLQGLLGKRAGLMNMVRVVYQSYENSQGYLRGSDCDTNPQPGPILSETEKTEEQIQDRSFEIYELFMDGARKRSENAAHKIGNMILLSNDDMGILICNKFMSLEEYLELYVGEVNVDREQEANYPLPPSFLEVMEFLEIEQYQSFRS